MNAPCHAHSNRTAEALGLITAALNVLRQGDVHPMDPALGTATGENRTARVRTLAEDMYKARASRSELLDPELFGEPAWDILLDLFIQHAKGRQVSITSSCIASQVPATTALRWITVLIDRGLVRRAGDVNDRRRAFVELTGEGLEKMQRFMDKVEADRAGF
jgi:DNA-binding MarR family transcriptional regulator